MRDPSDMGIAGKLRTVGFDELVDMGSVIVGSPGTVLERIVEVVRRFRIGNPARDAAVRLDAAPVGHGQYRVVRRDRAPGASGPVD